MKREKTGGRVKGTPNRTTQAVRETLFNALQNEILALPNYLAELPTEERINAIIKLIPYVIPKYADIEFSSNEGNSINIKHIFLNRNEDYTDFLKF